MAYKMTPLTALRFTDPAKFQKTISAALKKHDGTKTYAAQDLGVSLTTLKRWVNADAFLTERVAEYRGAKK